MTLDVIIKLLASGNVTSERERTMAIDLAGVREDLIDGQRASQRLDQIANDAALDESVAAEAAAIRAMVHQSSNVVPMLRAFR